MKNKTPFQGSVEQKCVRLPLLARFNGVETLGALGAFFSTVAALADFLVVSAIHKTPNREEKRKVSPLILWPWTELFMKEC